MQGEKQYRYGEFITKIENDSQLQISDFVILTCAIGIASVGLNMNSVATIIGAMLISPLMGPILGLGVGLAASHRQLFFKAALALIIEVTISLLASTLYFKLTPITVGGSEILNRTAPTLWDVLIAVFGGTAGVIGATKKQANNIVPGVAIATALMPPLCTAGYGLAQGNLTYFGGALYLFLINSFFIMLTAWLGIKFIYRQKNQVVERRPLMRFITIVMIALGGIPSLVTTKNVVQETIAQSNIQTMIAEEFKQGTIISQSIDVKSKKIRLSIAQANLNRQEIQKINHAKSKYNLQDYDLQIIQVADLNQLTSSEYSKYINNLINNNRKDYQAKQEVSFTKKLDKVRQVAQAELGKKFTKVTLQTNYDVSAEQIVQSYDVEIIVKDKLSDSQKGKLIKKIKKTLKQVDQIKFTVK
ncbi:TIGR00341 family protein [Ligilactobacillus equi]